jgi:hypothetical protein
VADASTLENSLVAHLDQCEPNQWLALVRWAAPEMIRKGEQRLLAELLCREAQRRHERWPEGVKAGRKPSDEIGSVLSDVGVKLVLAES